MLDNHFLLYHINLYVFLFERDYFFELLSGKMIAYLFFRIHHDRILKMLMLRRNVGILKAVLRRLLGRNCSLVVICCHEGVRCSISGVGEAVIDLY